MEIAKVAFLETYTLSENGGVMGAILVTDAETKPLEFRVTAPIRPTSFQKTLYGDVLLEHILVELISVPLLNAVNEQIDLIVVKDPLFLGANNKQGIRVVRLLSDEKEKSRSNTAVELLNTPLNGSAKGYVETSKKFEAELKGIKESLEKIAEARNLSEPFERLKAACEQVQLQRTND
jgi:hypothetical protein